MQKSKLNKTLLIFSITIFLACCFLFFFLYRGVKSNVEMSKESQVALDKEILRREEVKKFNDSFKSIEQDKTLFETHFAQSSDIVPFLNTIEKMAESVNIKAEVSFVEVSKDNTGLVVEMKDTGNFEGVYKFLTLLENSPYELEFTSIEMHSVPADELMKNKKNIKVNTWEAIFKIKLISFI